MRRGPQDHASDGSHGGGSGRGGPASAVAAGGGGGRGLPDRPGDRGGVGKTDQNVAAPAVKPADGQGTLLCL